MGIQNKNRDACTLRKFPNYLGFPIAIETTLENSQGNIFTVQGARARGEKHFGRAGAEMSASEEILEVG